MGISWPVSSSDKKRRKNKDKNEEILPKILKALQEQANQQRTYSNVVSSGAPQQTPITQSINQTESQGFQRPMNTPPDPQYREIMRMIQSLTDKINVVS